MRLDGRGREPTDWTSWAYCPTVMVAGQKFVVEVGTAGAAETVEGASVRPVPISTTDIDDDAGDEPDECRDGCSSPTDIAPPDSGVPASIGKSTGGHGGRITSSPRFH